MQVYTTTLNISRMVLGVIHIFTQTVFGLSSAMLYSRKNSVTRCTLKPQQYIFSAYCEHFAFETYCDKAFAVSRMLLVLIESHEEDLRKTAVSLYASVQCINVLSIKMSFYIKIIVRY